LARHGREPSRTGVCRKERARRTTGVAGFSQGRRYWRTETVDAPAGFAQGKCKLIQIKPREKAFISFHFLCRIGAFQWVTANPNKKFPLSISGFAKRPN
jgi:hypothetical protein